MNLEKYIGMGDPMLPAPNLPSLPPASPCFKIAMICSSRCRVPFTAVADRKTCGGSLPS